MLIDEIKECSKCGICRSTCPIFSVKNDEASSPRGRLSLIEAIIEKNLSISERYIRIIRACIKCTRCSKVCPVGVKVEDIIQSSRNMLKDTEAERIFELIIDRRKLVDAISRKDSSSSIPLWQLPMVFHGDAYVPKLSPKTVLDAYSEHFPAYSKPTLKVALFVGCSINYCNTEIADAGIEVLRRLGIDVFIPKDQLCCGAPLLLFGDVDGFKEIARLNVTALRYPEYDAILTLCPACGVTLRKDYKYNCFGDFSSKIYDISELIAKFSEIGGGKLDTTVTYHDPCYLRLGQGVFNEPRQILSRLAEFVEMKGADRCCGLGGTLGVFEPDTSLKILQKKINSIIQTDADIVVTGCPGCIMFLRQNLPTSEKKVLHTVQILAQCLI